MKCQTSYKRIRHPDVGAKDNWSLLHYCLICGYENRLKSYKINEFFAWVIEDDSKDQNESIIFYPSKEKMIPMISYDLDSIMTLKPIVKGMVKRTGQLARLIRFTTREEIAVITPHTVKKPRK